MRYVRLTLTQRFIYVHHFLKLGKATVCQEFPLTLKTKVIMLDFTSVLSEETTHNNNNCGDPSAEQRAVTSDGVSCPRDGWSAAAV